VNGPDRVGELLGQGQRVAHQSCNALPQGVVEAVDVLGLPRPLAERLGLRRRNPLRIHHVWIGVKRGVLPGRLRTLGPQGLSTRVATLAHGKGNHVACRGIHGDPYPLLGGWLLHKAGPCIGFHLQALDQHSVLTGDRAARQRSGQGLKTLDEEASEPLEGAPHRATNTPQRETFEPSPFDKTARILRAEILLAALDAWASPVVAMMVLFAIGNVAIVLVFGGLAPRTHVSNNHGWLLTSTGWVCACGSTVPQIAIGEHYMDITTLPAGKKAGHRRLDASVDRSDVCIPPFLRVLTPRRESSILRPRV